MSAFRFHISICLLVKYFVHKHVVISFFCVCLVCVHQRGCTVEVFYFKFKFILQLFAWFIEAFSVCGCLKMVINCETWPNCVTSISCFSSFVCKYQTRQNVPKLTWVAPPCTVIPLKSNQITDTDPLLLTKEHQKQFLICYNPRDFRWIKNTL